MSEAGKVSLPGMTPERKEEIANKRRLMDWNTLQCVVIELLAALEETQQQLKETEDWEEDAYAWRDFCDERNNLDPNEFTEDNFVMMRQEIQDVRQQIEPLRRNNQEWQTELLKAQQTIARQRENERAFLHEVSEIHMEAYAGSNGSLDRADTAIKRIMLLSSNLMARGGETQP